MIFYAKKTDKDCNFKGIDIFDPAKLGPALRKIKDGTLLEVVIRRRQKTRTNPQNAYYHGVVVEMLSEHLGYEHDEMHEIIKSKFLMYYDHNNLPHRKSSAGLSTVEMEDLLEKCRRWAAVDFGVNIPLPNEEV